MGAQLRYDNEGQLAHWQSSPSSPGSTDDSLYDGEGNRVEQQSVSGATTTTTLYVGSLEQDTTTQSANTSSTTRTQYYYANGQRLAVSTNGTLFYLASDGLGSTQLALDGSGVPMGSQLYAPYGSVRYQSGTMPLDYGFTGQHSDSVTGLYYYGARYYDPLAGQFASADTMLPGAGYDVWGLSRYAYVEGNPESATDPSGEWPKNILQKGWIVTAGIVAVLGIYIGFKHPENVQTAPGSNTEGTGVDPMPPRVSVVQEGAEKTAARGASPKPDPRESDVPAYGDGQSSKITGDQNPNTNPGRIGRPGHGYRDYSVSLGSMRWVEQLQLGFPAHGSASEIAAGASRWADISAQSSVTTGTQLAPLPDTGLAGHFMRALGAVNWHEYQVVLLAGIAVLAVAVLQSRGSGGIASPGGAAAGGVGGWMGGSRGDTNGKDVD